MASQKGRPRMISGALNTEEKKKNIQDEINIQKGSSVPYWLLAWIVNPINEV